jgi:hypothetical protein
MTPRRTSESARPENPTSPPGIIERASPTQAGDTHVSDVGRVRLAAQGLAPVPSSWRGDAAACVAALGAVQAQDLGPALTAVALRTGLTTAAVTAALDAGRFLRMHTLRGTWQFVAPADVHVHLALVAERLRAQSAGRHRQLGLDAPTLLRAERVLAAHLSAAPEGQATREDLAHALAAGGIDAAGQRLAHLLVHAELAGVMTSGRRVGKDTTFMPLDARIPRAGPAPSPVSRIDALVHLARQYFTTRGPASEADFAWWAGLTRADARAAIAALGGESTLTVTVSGGRRLHGPKSPPAPVAVASALLLPAFDEFLIAYQDRSDVLDPVHVRRINAGGGMLDPFVVFEGRVFGTWRRAARSASSSRPVRLSVTLFDAPTPGLEDALRPAAEVHGRAVGHAVELSVEPR